MEREEDEDSPEFNEKYLKMSDEFWEKSDPEFHELMKKVQSGGANKETTEGD